MALLIFARLSLRQVRICSRYIQVNITQMISFSHDLLFISVASIPELMKTILLIKNDEERRFAMSTSIIRRIMTHESSVGPWLTTMLQSSDRKLSETAIEYLKVISSLS